MADKFDLIVVGTGFASSFFLASYLEKSPATVRVLVLERGQLDTHEWQVKNQRTASRNANDTFINNHPEKAWIYNPAFGGGSNCWWAVTPRMLPNDFHMQSRYGVGVDWPLSYDDLEIFYAQAEEMMAISGPSDDTPFPRSTPYPQPPHLFSEPDKRFKAAYPDLFFHQPTARARVATPNRPRCCATGACGLCPINVKFTILNEMNYLYQDPRVTLTLGATVQSIETQSGLATGVNYVYNNVPFQVQGDLIVLGANALFNPHILQRSNIHHPLLGKFLNEQVGLTVVVDLDGLDNFQGSTSITGHGYMLYEGEHRKKYAACLIETSNVPQIRIERGKWQQRLQMKFIYENMPEEQNHVKFNPNQPDLPETIYTTHSDYTLKGMAALPTLLPSLLAPLPVEKVTIMHKPESSEAHILGTTVMGDNPQTSIVDKHLIHHQIRNLLVLGSGTFPTVAPANPTLTLSALSLWAANNLLT